MALWTDPLDELIADLERALPPISQQPAIDSDALLVGCQLLVGATIWGTPEDVARVEQDPRVKYYMAHLERLARRRGTYDDSREPEGT